MLPRIDLHGGRGARREILSRNGTERAEPVALPRLRLLKQIGGDDAGQQLPPLAGAQGESRSSIHAMPAPLPPQRRLLPSRGDSSERRLSDGSKEQPRRGRGLLRPLNPGSEREARPRETRAPPVLPWAQKEEAIALDDEDDEIIADALQRRRAQDRVRERRRQQKKAAREEEERRVLEDQEKNERVWQQAGEVEAYRRNLARQAADRQRRLKEGQEICVQEREELQSARRERIRRYQTPSQIREIRRLDPHPRHLSKASASDYSGSVVSIAPADDIYGAIEDACSCGNVFLPDSLHCRKCGEKRPAQLKEISPPRGAQRRGGRPAQGRAQQGSRDRERRHHDGRSRGGARDRRHSNNGKQSEALDSAAEPTRSPGNAASLKEKRKVKDPEPSYHQQHFLNKMLKKETWSLFYAAFDCAHRKEAASSSPDELDCSPVSPVCASTVEANAAMAEVEVPHETPAPSDSAPATAEVTAAVPGAAEELEPEASSDLPELAEGDQQPIAVPVEESEEAQPSPDAVTPEEPTQAENDVIAEATAAEKEESAPTADEADEGA